MSGGRQCGSLASKVAKGCRLVCKTTFAADPVQRRACADDCYATLQADKADCLADIGACQNVCNGTANEECANAVCSVEYNECRDLVREATQDCVRAADKDGVAIQACIEPGDAGMSLGRAALDDCISNVLANCIAGC